ncbi:MAG: Coenzyme F420 hydrogenase/dehydrogenase, beta subunit C-terminal domain [Patescibacteria group bacterium]
MWWEKLKNEILDTDLYTRSGTEVGVSEGTLILEEKDGDYFCKKVGQGDIPETSYSANTDKGIPYPKLNEFIFGQYPKNWLIGNYKKIFIGHWNDEKIRRNGASGGVLSGIQSYLLEKNMIDGAVTLRMRRDKPYLTEPIIATTESEIMEGAQSKYTTAPMNQILGRLPGAFQSLVYTGLPEEIAAIQILKMMGHPSVKNINYILGTFYGEAIGFSAIKSIIRANGIKDASNIKSLQFRAGEWPGNMRIELKDGKMISIPKLYANYLIPSHITKFSLYQVDYMAELADIAVGDAWAPSYESQGGGWSVIIARSQKGLDLLNKLNKDSKINLQEISENELIAMHSHGLDFKKRGAFIRIAKRKAEGIPFPTYGYEPVNISASRKRFESLLGIMFSFFRSPATIWLLERLPVVFIGWFFIRARNIWKYQTRLTKKNSLSDLKFQVIK